MYPYFWKKWNSANVPLEPRYPEDANASIPNRENTQRSQPAQLLRYEAFCAALVQRAHKRPRSRRAMRTIRCLHPPSGGEDTTGNAASHIRKGIHARIWGGNWSAPGPSYRRDRNAGGAKTEADASRKGGCSSISSRLGGRTWIGGRVGGGVCRVRVRCCVHPISKIEATRIKPKKPTTPHEREGGHVLFAFACLLFGCSHRSILPPCTLFLRFFLQNHTTYPQKGYHNPPQKTKSDGLYEIRPSCDPNGVGADRCDCPRIGRLRDILRSHFTRISHHSPRMTL